MEEQLYDQLDLFDIGGFDINTALVNLRNSIRNGWRPFAIDTIQKAAIMHHVSCGVVLDTYEKVTYEQLSDDSED